MIGRFRQHDQDAAGSQSPGDGAGLRLGDVMRGERATMGKSLLDVQRELKIKAAYIAAIENADPSAFETPGFVAGYVRSYARYLSLDPDWAFQAFCVEGAFEPSHGMSPAAKARSQTQNQTQMPRKGLGDMPLALAPRTGGLLSRIEPGAVGSMLVLIGLIGLIGYGGYSVLTEVQKVQFVPVDQSPQVLADIDPLSAAAPTNDSSTDASLPGAAPDRFDRLYRPEALDVPVMVARDGPIATLDPRLLGAWAGQGREAREALSLAADPVMPLTGLALAGLDGGGDALEAPESETPLQVVADAAPDVVVFAVRPSWVRVRSADGTTIYEKIMNEGDRFVLPKTEEPATLRTGESGAVYFSVNGEPYGPAGRPGTVTGGLALDASSLKAAYDVADLARDTALARVVVELRADPPSMPGEAPAPAARD